MIKKFGVLAFSAVLGLSLASLHAQTASAAGLVAVQGDVQPNASKSVLQLVKHERHVRMRGSWNRHRDGRRCSHHFGNCRHFHNGYYYETPWWTVPLFVGGGIAAQSLNDDFDDYGGYDDYGDSHVQWCLDRYRSYNVRTNTWVAYSGAVRQCRSPYD